MDADGPPGPGPPEALARWTGFLLAWVATTGLAHYSRALASLGITPQHLGVLVLLQDGPSKQAELSRRLSVFQPVMVGLINELETLGAVRRRPHPHDRRAVQVHLQPAGAQYIRDAEHVSRRATDTFFAALTADERQIFHGLLTKLATSTPTGPDEDAEP